MQSELQRTRYQIDLEEQSRKRLREFAAVMGHKAIEKRATSLADLVAQGRHKEAFERWNASVKL
jgi:hypothetical protein